MADIDEMRRQALAALAQKRFDRMQGAQQPAENVVATTNDGGRVIKSADGSLSFASPGYSTSDPARIAEIMKGAKPVDMMQTELDRERIAANPVAARVQEFNQGAPVVGEWLDEAYSGIGRGIGGAVGVVAPETGSAITRGAEVRAENMRRTSDAMERQHPGQTAALNIAGGIAYTAPLLVGAQGGRAADFVARGGTTTSRAARAGAVAAPAGAVEGAAAFAGRADDGGRTRAAATGAVVGGGLAALLGPVASMTGEGVANLARRVKRLDVKTIADGLGISSEAARVVRRALSDEDMVTAQRALSRLGDDAMLADAGPSTATLLDAGANTGGAALRTTRGAVNERASVVSKRLSGVLDTFLGPVEGIKAAARDISKRTAPARQAAYDAAYNTPINYATKKGRDIEATLRRVPPSVLESAIRKANDKMRMEGVVNRQIMAKIDDTTGEIAFQEMPNVQQLDEIKQALSAVGREAVDNFGRVTRDGIGYKKLSRDLNAAIGEAVHVYRKATKLGGDKIQQDEALEMGKNLLFQNVKKEDVKDFVSSGLSVEARKALRRGMRESIEETLGNVKRTITDSDVDAREMMKLAKELSSRNNIAKVSYVLGNARAKKLIGQVDNMMAALELRAAIAPNSKTAVRQSVQEQMAAEVAPGAVRQTLGRMGNPLNAADEVVSTIAGIDPRSMNERQRQYFAEIAKALVNIRGDDARKALITVRKAMNGQPIKDAEAALIGRVVGDSVGLAGYQTGKQSQAGR